MHTRTTRLGITILGGLLAATAPQSPAVADAALEAVRASVRLHGGGESGTGFLVAVPDGGPLLLVSAAHTFAGIDGPTCTIVGRLPAAGGGFERREVVVPVRAEKKPLWRRHPSLDVAVMPVSLPEEIAAAAFPLSRLATEADFDSGKVRVGQRVRVACFPAQVEANAAGWPVLRTGSIASHPLLPAAKLERFFVDYSNFGGDSGAAVVAEPIIEAGSPLVVGVVVAMQRQTDRTTSPFEETVRHTPLGLAISVPSPRLLELIEKRDPKP